MAHVGNLYKTFLGELQISIHKFIFLSVRWPA